jgi:hypothetical protein
VFQSINHDWDGDHSGIAYSDVELNAGMAALDNGMYGVADCGHLRCHLRQVCERGRIKRGLLVDTAQ